MKSLKIPVLTLTFLLATAWWGCGETPLPPVVIEEPVFFAKGTVGGEALDLRAGDDGYFLETGFARDNGQVYSFWGELSAPGKNRLRITVRDREARSPGASVDPAAVLTNGAYAYYFRDSVLTGYEATFTADAPSSAQLQWNIDGTTQTGNPVRQFFSVAEADSFGVSLFSVDGRNCRSLIRERVQVPKPVCYVDFTYKASPVSGRTLQFEVQNAISANDLIWTFNNTRVRAGRQTSFTFPSRGVFRTCVEQDGCKAQRCRNVNSGNVGSCDVNFSYTTEPVYKVDDQGYGEVLIEWENARGEVYRSELRAQEFSSQFLLRNREAYETNASGQATEKMDLDIRCWLYKDQDSILVTLPEVSWAVAYPKG